MDERKKSGSSGEEAVRVGPYRLEEKVRRDDDRQGALYRAPHEKSGAAVVVREPPVDMKVRIISSVLEGYDALEVEQTPRSVGSDKPSMETMLLTLEDVHKVVERMRRAASASREPRFWRYLRRMRLVGVPVLCVLAFALGRYVSVSPSTVTGMPDPGNDGWLADGTSQGEPVLARPLPREPVEGQKRPPCTRDTEVELIGACWVPHEMKAPCSENLYEHQTECYLPIFSAKPPSQSVGQ
jgi:hypothetical protein